MKDLFSGSLGRLNNHGGSRMFTTPNTINVPPEYEVETDVPSVAEFVTCSLDGRLWVFKRSRRYYVAVFRWDADTQRLVFVSSTVFSNINIIGRGIDWILTDSMIIQASDNEPYISTANLFEGSETTFLYSALRYKELTSGIDSFTGEAWGMSEDTGNSEGYGYFNRTALLQSVNKHYSLLPAIGDWHIIKNFLVRKADNPLSEAHNSMLNIRPLIPLEFNGVSIKWLILEIMKNNQYTSYEDLERMIITTLQSMGIDDISSIENEHSQIYGCGFDNDISLTCFNGKLWGRGRNHIGKCCILPAVFDEDGTPQEFYLYISPDYPVSPYINSESKVTEAEWLNLGILHIGENVYGFVHEQTDSLDNGLCYKSDASKIFMLSANDEDEQSEDEQEQQISENRQMFIDTLTQSGLAIDDNGATFLNSDNLSYQCKGLRQWLAPSGKVDVVTSDTVISSWDNTALAVHVRQGFHRELLTGKRLSITAKSFDGKRLSLGLKDKTVQVNSMNGIVVNPAIDWQSIFKSPITINVIKHCDIYDNEMLDFVNHFFTYRELNENFSVPYPDDVDKNDISPESIVSDLPIFFRLKKERENSTIYDIYTIYLLDIESGRITSQEILMREVLDSIREELKQDKWKKIGNAKLEEFWEEVRVNTWEEILNKVSPPIAKTKWDEIRVKNWSELQEDDKEIIWNSFLLDIEYSKIVYKITIGVFDDKIGFLYTIVKRGTDIKDVKDDKEFWEFKSVMDVPDFINPNISTLGFMRTIPSNILTLRSNLGRFSNEYFVPVLFQEYCSNVSFIFGINLNAQNRRAFYDDSHNYIPMSRDFYRNDMPNVGWHIIGSFYGDFFLLKSEVHPEIFDFKSEAERSKPS